MTRRVVRRRAYAKLNLVLRVGPRRPDGYHEVATLLQAVSLHDRLAFRPRARGFTLTVTGPRARGVPSTGENLVLRAARLLAEDLRESRGASIALVKRVPHGAGLGGGSSDAAATLRGLLALWGRRLAPERLAALAARLGSDVPFFLGPGRAVATGRGEIVTPVPALRQKDRWVVVVPDVEISTAWAYGNYRAPKSRLTAWKQAVNVHPLSATVERGKKLLLNNFNDLEGVVLPCVPAVREAAAALRDAGAVGVQMSGSGSALFGRGTPSLPPRAIAARLRRRFSSVFVVDAVAAGSKPGW